MSCIAECLGIEGEAVVALVGAGGKTTLAWSVARDLVRGGNRAMVTATTRTRAGEEPAGTPVVAWKGPEGTASAVEAALVAGVPPLVVSGRTGDGKHLGIDPAEVDALARLAHAAILVEADGSRGLPFKVPRHGEPVIPSSATHVAVVMGLAALGRPAGPDTVFGHASLLDSGLLAPGEHLGASAARRLLLGPHGYLPHLCPARRNAIVVNGDDLESAGSFARDLWHPAIHDTVAASALEGKGLRVANSADNVVGVVLAGGSSTRFGSLKQAALVDGRPMVSHPVGAALGAGLERVIVVVGARAPEVVAALGPLARDPRVTIVLNDRPGDGMSGSLKAAKAAARPAADAFMIFLSDMPGVDWRLARRVLDRYRASAAVAAAPLLDGRTGHPAILRSQLFDEVDALEGDVGARAILEANADRTAKIELDDRSSQKDVDLPADLART